MFQKIKNIFNRALSRGPSKEEFFGVTKEKFKYELINKIKKKSPELGFSSPPTNQLAVFSELLLDKFASVINIIFDENNKNYILTINHIYLPEKYETFLNLDVFSLGDINWVIHIDRFGKTEDLIEEAFKYIQKVINHTINYLSENANNSKMKALIEDKFFTPEICEKLIRLNNLTFPS